MADHGHGGGDHGGGHGGGGSSSGGGSFKWQPIVGGLSILLVVGVVLMVILSLLGVKQGGGQQAGSANYAVSTTAAGACDGVSRTYTIGSSNEVINGGTYCELVGWQISSPVVLVADNGDEQIFTAAQAFNFRAAYWRAARGSATVTAVFCPPHTVWNGVNSCS